MNGLGWAAITLVAWGIWLVPAQWGGPCDDRLKTLWITLGNLALALPVALWADAGGTDLRTGFAPALAGGMLWGVSGILAIGAVRRLGMARAMSIWAPLNILTSLAWGGLLFGEFSGFGARGLGLLGLGVALMVAGILLVIRASGLQAGDSTPGHRAAWPGLLAAFGAGIGWGSYFIPLRWADISPWTGALPMALGMTAASLIAGGLGRRPERLTPRQSGLAGLSGVLWAAGNYGSLQMIAALGAGRGFTVAQACMVVNAIVGVFFFRTPPANTPAGRRTLAGAALAAAGAALVGLSR